MYQPQGMFYCGHRGCIYVCIYQGSYNYKELWIKKPGIKKTRETDIR